MVELGFELAAALGVDHLDQLTVALSDREVDDEDAQRHPDPADRPQRGRILGPLRIPQARRLREGGDGDRRLELLGRKPLEHAARVVRAVQLQRLYPVQPPPPQRADVADQPAVNEHQHLVRGGERVETQNVLGNRELDLLGVTEDQDVTW